MIDNEQQLVACYQNGLTQKVMQGAEGLVTGMAKKLVDLTSSGDGRSTGLARRTLPFRAHVSKINQSHQDGWESPNQTLTGPSVLCACAYFSQPLLLNSSFFPSPW